MINKMKNKMKNYLSKVKKKLDEKIIDVSAEKIIALLLAIIGFLAFAIYNNIIYPSFSGNIIEVSYDAQTNVQEYGKTVSFITGTTYYYEGDLQVVVEGQGNIESAYFVYGEKDNEVTSGDVYAADVKSIGNKEFAIAHTINIYTDDTKQYRQIYLIVIDKKNKEKNIYCVPIKLESMNISRIYEIKMNEENSTMRISSVREDASTKFQYEAYSKEEIQKLVNNDCSYVGLNKREILQTIEKVEGFKFQ